MAPTIEPCLADQLGHPTRQCGGGTSLQKYTRINEGESSFNSLEILQSWRIDCMIIKYSTSEMKHIYFDSPCSSVYPTIGLVDQSMLYLSNVTKFSHRFYDDDASISIDERDIRSLNCSYPEYCISNFALHVIRNLMCQIIKAEEEADAAHEFITNLPNDLVGKLVRESPNYLSITIGTIDINIEFYYTRYENIRCKLLATALNRESRRVVQEVGNSY
ncbi:mitochondrial potassium channel ATP-binding subunit-like isoform X2 [Vespula maculifrons]|uniref:Mitochondrial potassium channel ATP-binding subunit-like isoform X2 n=1 Tax=Vespula maculifrons TaxID=7453 RepID=A0ABD2D1R1_VESMC